MVALVVIGTLWVFINDKYKPFADKIRKGVVEYIKSWFKK
jgi:hypothetical protein